MGQVTKSHNEDDAHGNVDMPASGRAHIVDAAKGPLIGAGLWHRTSPFAVTTAISMGIAVPATSWIRPNLALLGLLLLAVAIVSALVFPWKRVARHAQLLPPFLFLVGSVILTAATGSGIASPFVAMSVIPLMWLAIYEHRTAVILAVFLAGMGVWLVAPAENSAVATSSGAATAAIFVVCGGMGLTLHGLVAGARSSALALRQQNLALQRSEAVLDAVPERVAVYRVSDHVITYCNLAWAAQFKVGVEENSHVTSGKD